MLSRTLAIAAALITLTGACVQPPSHPVRTEAEAIALARHALTKTSEESEPLTAEFHDPNWVVATPRRPSGTGWSQMAVTVDSRTGQTSTVAYQTAIIDEDL